MKINVIGLGYIGLPTALMLASKGIQIVGTDYNQNIIESLEKGKITFEEEGLEELFKNAVANNIVFTTQYITTDTYIICVPTPYDKTSKKIDTIYVNNAIKEVMKVCSKGAIIIIESTVAPGTVDRYIRPVIESNGFIIGTDIHIVHAPERILPGNMLYELENNSRTIGADEVEVGVFVKQLYETFCTGDITITDIRTAEMSKVIENTYRDINIAFANELMRICRCENLDVYEIIKIANMHPRVNILQPGPGVGGHCISVDPWFLVGDHPDLASIIWQARKTNDSQPEFVYERISEIMKTNNITNIERVGLYGLTYKENVDDTRESPTLQLLEKMRKHLVFGIKVYDPYIKNDIVDNQYHDVNQFFKDIDMVIIMVNHDELLKHRNLFEHKVILDTKNISSDFIKL